MEADAILAVIKDAITTNKVIDIFFILILKPRIALTYTDGWLFNLKILKRTLKKREWIQKRRVVGDSEIVKKMYIGSGKLLHLIEFIRLGYSYGKK